MNVLGWDAVTDDGIVEAINEGMFLRIVVDPSEFTLTVLSFEGGCDNAGGLWFIMYSEVSEGCFRQVDGVSTVRVMQFGRRSGLLSLIMKFVSVLSFPLDAGL